LCFLAITILWSLRRRRYLYAVIPASMRSWLRALFFTKAASVQSQRTNIVAQDLFKTVSVEEFCEIARIGRTRAYELFETGAVKSVLVGRLRLVLLQSWYDHLARLCEEQTVFTPGRRPGRAQAAGKPALTETEPPPPRRRGRPPKYPRSDTAVNPAQAAAAIAASNSNN